MAKAKGKGYSLRIHRDLRVGVGVRKTGPRTWLVEYLTAAAADEPFPGDFRQQAAGGSVPLTMVAPDETARAVMISLPLLKGKELKQGVLGTVARQEKCAPGDLVVSWRVLGRHRDPAGEIQQDLVALVMSLSDRGELLQQATGLGLEPSRLLPGYAVLDEMFRLVGPAVPDGGAWALVYLGGDENFLNISSPESLLLTRSLPVNLDDSQDQDAFLERLATEIERSRFFIRQGAHSPDIRQVVVCGDPALAGPLAEHLNAEQGGQTAVHWTAEHLFSHQGDPVSTAYLLPALGAALSLEQTDLNLLDRGRRSLLGRKASRRLMLAGTAAAVGLVPMVLAGSVLTARIQENYLVKARQSLEEARVRAAEAAEIYKASRLLDHQQLCLDWKENQRLDVQSLLTQLAAAAPDPVVFRSVRVYAAEEGGYRLRITGDSLGDNAGQAQARYLRFQKALSGLEALEGFEEPRIMEIETARRGSAMTPLTHFTLDLEIAPRAQEQS